MDFVEIHAKLLSEVEIGELPNSDEISSLTDTLKNGALDIRANHPKIAANRDKRAQRAIQELTAEQKQQLNDAIPILQAITKGEAHDDIKDDVFDLVNNAIGPIPNHAPPIGPAVRLVNRASKISILVKSKDVINRIAESTTMTGAKIIQTIHGIVELAGKFFGLF